MSAVLQKLTVCCLRSRQADEESEAFTSMMGLMQALLSVFLDDGDKLRCINAGKMRITFLLRSPLYYACVSSWGEPESVVSSCSVKCFWLDSDLGKERHASI